ncbi:MAG: ABC transporter substrate-binding protein [Hydrogenophaga sp.]|uniref:ABC transporter substrate-binding protein n=1 Tax=Hydrogenophaga sp. TaxID=1904254 RepID=UPI002751B469|nr:ABC transporter substrate-binding protein [Hydrogenophaga sp.]MDP2418113.1 ABC transporter substrate-binding protein [Hydrogenophaga sp.]MDZ4189612.1 ABC transporter substrate-binding protein [Hydrogenophaga sp.]
MNKWHKALIASACLAASAAQAQTVNIICSVQADWCDLIHTVYTKLSGHNVNIVQKTSGEALAQLNAERENPKTDIWFGGTGDPHLTAAEQGLTQEYKSDALKDLHPWAQKQAADAGYRTVGVYLGPLGFGYNTERLERFNIAPPTSWSDLLKPGLKGEVQVANPASSGTAYTMIATLVQIMGEDKAFEYLKGLHKNVSLYTRSGSAPAKAAARGETTVSISFIHDVTSDAVRNFPVKSVSPSEGTGAEIGSMSLVKGSPNAEAAKKFYDWALTPSAQQIGLAAKQYQLPSNKNSKIDPRMPDTKKIKLINYDYAKYGASIERRRLIARWQKDVNSQPNE